MDRLANDAVRRAVVVAIFFASGAASLIYEISWSRQIGLFFGHTAHAAALVLCSYFAGMALGNAIGARWATRIAPLAGYGIAELLAAAWACAIPTLLQLAQRPPFLALLTNPSPAVQTTLRAAFCFLLFLPATAALGTTLPLVAEFFSRLRGTSSRSVDAAYAANTAGALVGVCAATFWLLLVVGVVASSYLAAGLTALCGVASLALTPRPWFNRQAAAAPPAPAARLAPEERSLAWPAIVTVSGAGVLGLEVLYAHLFALIFHNSTYTFGIVVAVILAGLAAAAAVASGISRFASAEHVAAVACGGAALTTPLSVLIFVSLTRLEYFRFGESFAAYLIGGAGLVALVALPSVFLLGMILPTAWRAARQQRVGHGAAVGRLTAVNTLAAAVGGAAASFVLVPGVGLWGAFALLALVFYAAAALLLRRAVWLSTLLGIVVAALVTASVVAPPRVRQQLLRPGQTIVEHWQGAYGLVELVRSPGNVWAIQQNVHYRLGATGSNAAREYRQGHVPLLLHPRPKDVLFLGLGTGLTAGAALAHPEVERVDVVELVPEAVEAAHRLEQFNNRLLDDPKVALTVDDGRHFLLATTRRYDVIVSDLFVPWESQTGYLYTVEHYRLGRARLRPGGMYCQWLALYQMGGRELETIAETFASVFPHVTVWWAQVSADGPMLALIGAEQTLTVDLTAINARLAAKRASPARSDDYLGSSRDLLFLYVGDWPAGTSASRRLNTDEHPRIEFMAPISHRNRSLLQRRTMLAYYDRALARLPASGVRTCNDSTVNVPTIADTRVWNRTLLSGCDE
jgi:spermidine synthase